MVQDSEDASSRTSSAESDTSSTESSTDEDDATETMSDEQNTPPTSELEYAIFDITHVLKCLYIFSTVLHRPAPSRRLQKCASIKVHHYEFWDIAHARNRFPCAKVSIQERLGRANTKRRQLLLYYEKHHKKIAQLNLDPPPKPAVLAPMDTAAEFPGAIQPDLELSTGAIPDLDNDDIGTLAADAKPAVEAWADMQSTILSETTATTLHIEGNMNIPLEPLLDDQQSESGQTQTSYASSYASLSGTGGYRLTVPEPPHAEEYGFDGDPFECPCCHDIVVIRNSKAWK